MLNTVNQRLDFFRQSLHISKTEFATELKTSQSAMSQILSGKRPLSRGMIARIKQNHPRLNEQWLLTGEGDMIICNDKGGIYQFVGRDGTNYNDSLVLEEKVDEEVVELTEKSSGKKLMAEIHRLKILLFDKEEEFKKVKNELVETKKRLKAQRS